jgi:response regulator NasT
MELQQQTYHVLVVTASKTFRSSAAELLSETRCVPVQFASDISAAKRAVAETPFDFVIVNAPLKDEFGSRLCIDVTEHTGTLAVIFASSDVYEDIMQRTVSHGVFVVRKPSSQQTVMQAVSLLISAREMLRTVQKKAGKAEDKLHEIRIVNKAKWFLIDNEDMSESDAHQYIEKQAMNAGITKRQAAQIVIDRYLK